jgi:riboflavin kinase/FMN adenylyltransferase
VETFILDFDGELYGNDIALSFLRRIREEKKFSGPEELKKQIDMDVVMARQYFEEQGQ